MDACRLLEDYELWKQTEILSFVAVMEGNELNVAQAVTQVEHRVSKYDTTKLDGQHRAKRIHNFADNVVRMLRGRNGAYRTTSCCC